MRTLKNLATGKLAPKTKKDWKLEDEKDEDNKEKGKHNAKNKKGGES